MESIRHARKALPVKLRQIALRKFYFLDNAVMLEDLNMPPGNHLEALRHDRPGQYSIRINEHYGICFIWTDDTMRLPTNRPPVHPGEILHEEFMKSCRMTQKELSLRTGSSRKHIGEIVNCRKSISADTALRLSRLFGISPELRLNGQAAWDIWLTLHGEKACELETIEPLHSFG